MDKIKMGAVDTHATCKRQDEKNLLSIPFIKLGVPFLMPCSFCSFVLLSCCSFSFSFSSFLFLDLDFLFSSLLIFLSRDHSFLGISFHFISFNHHGLRHGNVTSAQRRHGIDFDLNKPDDNAWPAQDPPPEPEPQPARTSTSPPGTDSPAVALDTDGYNPPINDDTSRLPLQANDYPRRYIRG